MNPFFLTMCQISHFSMGDLSYTIPFLIQKHATVFFSSKGEFDIEEVVEQFIYIEKRE